MSGPVVVIGDALLDIDLVGRVRRVCPDAPAPVVEDIAEQARPGGAALAAVLAAKHGAKHGMEVVLVAPSSDDAPGRRLAGLMAEHCDVIGVPSGGGTAVKCRVRADQHTLARLDSGGASSEPGPLPAEAAAVLAGAGAILVSDYGRGLTAHPQVRTTLQAAAGQVPVVWDPHPRGAAPVTGCRMLTPNAGEATIWAQRLGRSRDGETLQVAAYAARTLLEAWRAVAVAVTLGARGALLSYGGGAPLVVPAPQVSSGDPCGAGDSFAAAVSVALARGALPSEAVVAAVTAAADFVAAGGAAAVAGPSGVPATGTEAGRSAQDGQLMPADVLARVRAAGGTVVATGGCFDLLHTGHVTTLQAARALGDCLVVCLNSDASVRRLKGPQRPINSIADRRRVLEALGCVDEVWVFEEDTPDRVLERLRPDIWVKGGDYAGAALPEESVLQRWGGQVVVLPYVEGRSTTGLVTGLVAAQG